MHGSTAMEGHTALGGRQHGAFWRVAPWVMSALLLLLPVVAMQFTAEVAWDEIDFIAFGAMLFGACGLYELAARMTPNFAYRAAVGVAVVAAFLLIWLNLAVGIIGSERNPANLMYGGLLAIGILGALVARVQPRGMARTLVTAAPAQMLIGALALVIGFGAAEGASQGATIVLSAFFAALWLISAWLFWKAGDR